MPPRPRPDASHSKRKPRPATGRPQNRRTGGPDRTGRRPDQVPEARGGRVAPSVTPDPDSDVPDDSDKMRLQKFLAMAGVDSRRNCEEYIRTGRVTVDTEVVTDPARAVDPKTQDIRLDSERLRMPRFRYFLVNKPKGVLCTNSDPQGRPRAVDLVPVSEQRLFTVGRLDENTEGMLLITNDGDLAQKLCHPRFEVIRRYRCHVAGLPQPETLNQLRDGMYFAEGYFKFRSVHVYKRRGQSTILELELQEGKNREIRRLMARVGHKVLALERVAFGPLQLGSLAPGRHRELQPFEIHELRHFAEHGQKGESRTPRKTNDGFGYRSGQTRGKRRTPATGKERTGAPPADRGPVRTSERPPMPSELPSLRSPDRPTLRSPERPSVRPERPSLRSPSRPADRKSSGTSERPADRKTGGTPERSPNRSAGGTSERPADRRTGGMPERPAGRSAGGTSERPADRRMGGMPERPAGRPSSRTSERSVERPPRRESSAGADREFTPRPTGQKSGAHKPVSHKSGARKAGVKKSGAKKAFRPASQTPSASINKGRDRRKNR